MKNRAVIAAVSIASWLFGGAAVAGPPPMLDAQFTGGTFLFQGSSTDANGIPGTSTFMPLYSPHLYRADGGTSSGPVQGTIAFQASIDFLQTTTQIHLAGSAKSEVPGNGFASVQLYASQFGGGVPIRITLSASGPIGYSIASLLGPNVSIDLLDANLNVLGFSGSLDPGNYFLDMQFYATANQSQTSETALDWTLQLAGVPAPSTAVLLVGGFAVSARLRRQREGVQAFIPL